MHTKLLPFYVIGFFLSFISFSSYAANDQARADEETVVGACMIQKFQQRTPPISDDKINKCSDAKDDAVPSCLGISENDYLDYVKFCMAQLENAKCVSTKMNTSLINYANCGYENDPVACFKGLGYTPDQIIQLSTECEKQAKG